MIREKSAGAVVYFPDGENIYILIEKMKQGHYSFPKGHMEGVETEAETAIREIREETGLEVVLDTGFRKTVEYSPYPGCLKEVVFFVAKARNRDYRKQEEEIEEIYFLKADEAHELLTFDSDKAILKAALEYINKPM
ncbi:MAG: NUDIX domain-containing protein [Bacilli bacterium]|jgi:bis(5'-nucleosidyl)-tetraphosphatase